MMNTNFDKIFVLSSQLNAETSNVIDVFVYRTGITSGRFSHSTAIGLFRSVIALILLLIANYSTRKLTDQSLY